MKRCLTNRALALLSTLLTLTPAWSDPAPSPAQQMVIPKELQSPPPGAWTSTTFSGVTQDIQKASAAFEGHNKAAGAQGILATSPSINPSGITILAFFNDLTPADDSGLCKIAAAARAYPNLVDASYYLVVSPSQAQPTGPHPRPRHQNTCLSTVHPRLDLGGALYSSLQPQGIPAALVMYRGMRQWIRLQDAALALNELFLAAGVPSPLGSAASAQPAPPP
jgi:hypothetical protein